MERVGNHNELEHVIDITRSSNGLPSPSQDDGHGGMNSIEHEDRTLSGTRATANHTSLSSSNRMNSRTLFITRGQGYARRGRSPLNSVLWISVELFVTVGQIIASIVVLSLSRHENPQAPLFAWVVGYACGLVATLPVLYWRYHSRNQESQQDSRSLHQGTSRSSQPSSEPVSHSAISVPQGSEQGNQQTGNSASRSGEMSQSVNSRIKSLANHFKMGLDCFFAVWFVVGNVWIFGSHSSPSEAPNLYRLCIVFLTFSCIGYAMPFILCATICCCWPCIISILGFREDLSQNRGATPESIGALPIYKVKMMKNNDNREANSGADDGGILAAGTEKELVVSREDAVCCICLAQYVEEDELRELPCSHFFHMECVDKWLKINSSCPLCKYEIGEGDGASPSSTIFSPQQM